MNRLRILRDFYGLSQQKLAEQIGFTQQKIHAYETGLYEPDIDTLIMLANFFDTSVDYLIGNTEERRKVDKVEPYELNEMEVDFLEKFRQIPPNLHQSILLYMDTLLDR